MKFSPWMGANGWSWSNPGMSGSSKSGTGNPNATPGDPSPWISPKNPKLAWADSQREATIIETADAYTNVAIMLGKMVFFFLQISLNKYFKALHAPKYKPKLTDWCTNTRYFILCRPQTVVIRWIWARVQQSPLLFGAVHKLCRLKISDFWPPPPLLVVFLPSKIGNFWTPTPLLPWDDIVYGRPLCVWSYGCNIGCQVFKGDIILAKSVFALVDPQKENSWQLEFF